MSLDLSWGCLGFNGVSYVSPNRDVGHLIITVRINCKDITDRKCNSMNTAEHINTFLARVDNFVPHRYNITNESIACL